MIWKIYCHLSQTSNRSLNMKGVQLRSSGEFSSERFYRAKQCQFASRKKEDASNLIRKGEVRLPQNAPVKAMEQRPPLTCNNVIEAQVNRTKKENSHQKKSEYHISARQESHSRSKKDNRWVRTAITTRTRQRKRGRVIRASMIYRHPHHRPMIIKNLTS